MMFPSFDAIDFNSYNGKPYYSAINNESYYYYLLLMKCSKANM